VPLAGQDAFEAPPLRPLRYLSKPVGEPNLTVIDGEPKIEGPRDDSTGVYVSRRSLFGVGLTALAARPHEATGSLREALEELTCQRLTKCLVIQRASCVLADVSVVVVDEMEGLLQLEDSTAGEAAPADPHQIEADEAVAFRGHRERGDVA
jgi:hypothetical protein